MLAAMDLASVQQRVEQLRGEIEQHNRRYHGEDAPAISDAAFDVLLEELRALEAAHPELQSPDSPTQRVGAAPAGRFPPVSHRVPMLGLANAFDANGLRGWHERISRLAGQPIAGFVIEPKVDGLAVTLRYEAGAFTLGATRGDGAVGEDVTANLQTVRSLPQSLGGDFPARLEVRGEVYLTRAAFQKINDERAARGEPLFANPRNCAAGSLRQVDPSVSAKRPLELLVYALGEADGWAPATQWEALETLPRWGFRTSEANARCETLDEVIGACRAWEARRQRLAYEVDGVVVKVDDRALQARLGAVGREPRWAIAYKFAPARATTRLRDVFVSVGRTGSLTPFALLAPVKVGGATLSMATLHNEGDMRRKDIRVGDTVLVQRAGEVMPYVVGPLIDRRPPGTAPFTLPETCPVCGAPAILPEGEAVRRCSSDFTGCAAQRRELLFHFCSRGGMDIQSIGRTLAQSLVTEGPVRDPGDLYFLTEGELTAVPRVGPKTARRILAEVEKSKARPFRKALFALGIRHVGVRGAEVLAEAFGSLERLRAASLDEITGVKGIGAKIGQSVYETLRHRPYVVFMDKLERANVNLVMRPRVE
ncbi:MAG TPA: NAD-dependent DNA ligase LigA [Chloroflexota bacterium]|nr:NAD-dependent DNA ligase LigA [Chloroflexota bacterium]